MLRRPLRLVAPALLAATIPACGGSGGGGGAPGPVAVLLDDATFQGAYFEVNASGRATGGTVGSAGAGVFSADGAGHGSDTSRSNFDGSLIVTLTFPFEYDVGSDGSLDLLFLGTTRLRGGVSADGECALLANVFPGASPGIMLNRRRSGFHTLASLSGDYYFVLLTTAVVGDATAGLSGNATFDGAGSMELTAGPNLMGTIGASFAITLDYSVTGDGTSVLDPTGLDLEGGISAGNDMGLWSGNMSSGGTPPAVAAALREATSAGLATFQGEYWIVCLARDPVSGDFRSFHGTASANGAGSVILTSTANTEGTITAEPPQTTTYSVAANGKFTVDAGGDAIQGGISQDGKYAILGGGTVAGSAPTICVLCRK